MQQMEYAMNGNWKLTVKVMVLMVLGTGVVTQAWAQGVQPPTPSSPMLSLSLRKAIEIGVENNYDLILSRERIEEARGVAFTRLGAMLPNLSGESNATKRRVFQGQFGGQDAVSDRRTIYDLRGRLTQNIFNLSLIHQWQSGKTGVEAADLEAEVTRRDTISTIALLYFEAIRAEASVVAREANVKLNKELWTMAEGRKAAGAATGLDVTRAKVQYQSERQRLLEAIIERNRARLNLIRVMGIPNDTKVVFTDALELVDMPSQTPEEAIKIAMNNRVELQAQDRRQVETQLRVDAIKGERIPSLDVRGDHGLIGEKFDDRFSSYTVGAYLSIPLFDGGQREGRIQESNSQLRQQRIRTKNLIHQVGLDARDALLTLESSREQVLVSKETLELSLKELELSQKAFSIGTITHLEIINAQASLAQSRDQAIEALFNFNAARVGIARSQGRMELLYQEKPMTAKSFLPGF
jgi:outer membrane protein TolC